MAQFSKNPSDAPVPGSLVPKEAWVADALQHVFLQRHAVLLQALHVQNLATRTTVIALLFCSWAVFDSTFARVWSIMGHSLALFATIFWRLGARRMSVEISAVERIMAGRDITNDEPRAKQWDDVYVHFRSVMSSYAESWIYRWNEQYCWLIIIVISAILRMSLYIK